MTETVRRSRRGEVLVLTVDRPHRKNALDPPTFIGLADALAEARDDPATRAVVLTAAGDDAFGAGMDLHSLVEDPDRAKAAAARFREEMDSPDRIPVVAAVNGQAMGGGFELALRCDLVVAAEHARFGLPEVSHGLMAGAGATLLPCRIPLAVALELGMTADPISAQRAHELGLVNHVVPGPEVLPRALELAGRIAAHAPLAVAWMRKAMWASLDGREAGWRETLAGLEAVNASRDMVEGLAAFREKRPPVWTGT